MVEKVIIWVFEASSALWLNSSGTCESLLLKIGTRSTKRYLKSESKWYVFGNDITCSIRVAWNLNFFNLAYGTFLLLVSLHKGSRNYGKSFSAVFFPECKTWKLQFAIFILVVQIFAYWILFHFSEIEFGSFREEFEERRRWRSKVVDTQILAYINGPVTFN